MKWTTFGWWLTLAITSASCWKSSTAACVGLRNILTATSTPFHSASTTSPNAPAPILRTTRTSGHGIVRYSVVFSADASRAAVSTTRMSRQQSAQQQHRSTSRQHAASRRRAPSPPPSPPASAATFGGEDEPEDAGVADVEVDELSR